MGFKDMALEEDANFSKNALPMRSSSSIEIASGRKSPTAKKPVGRTQQALTRLMAQYPEVQLATLVNQAPAGDKWVHEIKFDGYRLLGFVAEAGHAIKKSVGNLSR
jgi:ATP-dependent DNA ligase